LYFKTADDDGMMIGEEKCPGRTNLLWSDGKKKEDRKVMKSHSDDEQFVQYKYFKTLAL
jgi:hypothetical protein